MEDLTRSGKVRYVGCSNYWAWEVVSLVCTAKANGWQPLAAVQPLYNIVNRDIEVELLPMAHRMGLGVVTYSPLARGVLTGKYQWKQQAPVGSRLDRSDRRFMQAEWRAESVSVAQSLAPLAEQHQCSVAQLATAWAMSNKRVHSVIIGPKNLAQAHEYLGATEIVVDGETEAAIDALVPPGCHTGTGRPDPDYYPVLGRVVTSIK